MISVLFALILPFLLGGLILGTLLRGTSLPHKSFFILSAALPTGFGICSLILFTCLLAAPAYAGQSSWIAAGSLIAGLLIRSMNCYFKTPRKEFSLQASLSFLKSGDKRVWIQKIGTIAACALFVYTAWALIQFYFLVASTNVTGGWDARYFWSLKAKFMFRSPAEWQNLFSPLIPWSNQGYPLLWPGTLAWGWHRLGHEALLWAPMAALTFYLPCIFLLVWYLTVRRSAFAGWIGGTFALTLGAPLFWTLSQYADVPLACFITAGGFLLALALRTQESRLFLLAGLMGGLASWTKSEGLFFLVLLYFVAGIQRQHPENNGKNNFKRIRYLTLGAILPLAAALTVRYLARDCNAGDAANQTIASLGDLWSSGGKKAGEVLRSFYDHMSSFASWKGSWVFFTAATLVTVWKKREATPSLKALIALVLLLNLSYFVTLLATRPELLSWQIETALERLLIHSSFLAIAVSFETLTSRPNSVSK